MGLPPVDGIKIVLLLLLVQQSPLITFVDVFDMCVGVADSLSSKFLSTGGGGGGGRICC